MTAREFVLKAIADGSLDSVFNDTTAKEKPSESFGENAPVRETIAKCSCARNSGKRCCGGNCCGCRRRMSE